MNEKLLDNIRSLCKAEKYEEALKLIETVIKDSFVHPAILVWKAHCLEMSDDIPPYQFEDIEASLNKAIAIDDEYIPAIVELAYFHLNVLDNAGKAEELFERAIDLYREELIEAISGKAHCLAEMQSKDKALEFLERVTSEILDNEKMMNLREEISSA